MPRSQPEEQPWTDEIVAEVRSAREELFAACGYDLKKFAERLRAAQGTPVERRHPPADVIVRVDHEPSLIAEGRSLRIRPRRRRIRR